MGSVKTTLELEKAGVMDLDCLSPLQFLAENGLCCLVLRTSVTPRLPRIRSAFVLR